MRITENKRMYNDKMRKTAINEEWFDLADNEIYAKWFELTNGKQITTELLFKSAKMVYKYTYKYNDKYSRDYTENEHIANIMYILNSECITTTYTIE